MIQPLLFKSEPYNDELLSSWLTRNAYLNFMSLSSFLGSIFARKYYHIKDIDLYKFNEDFYNKLSYITNVPIKTIKSLQLYKFEGYIEEEIKTTGRHHWFTPAHPSIFRNSFYGIRFCPQCLKEDLYFKDIWRILFINICDKHECYLLNNCPNCKSSIDFTKNSYSLYYTKCWHCGFDLRESKDTKIDLNSHEFYTQKLLQKISQQGYYIFQNKVYYSIGLFFLLRILVRNVLRSNSQIHNHYLEQLKTHVLSFSTSQAIHLLENYPKNLIYFCKKNKFTNDHAFFDKYKNKKNNMPIWFTI